MVSTSVVIVNYRTRDLTVDAVASVLAEPEVGEVVVVDNASGDGSLEHLRAAFAGDGRVRVVASERNLGFGPAVNLAAGQCRLPLLLILNSDATVTAGSVGRLARLLLADDATALVAPAVYEADGVTPQPAAYGRLPRRRDVLLSNGWANPLADDPAQAATPGWVSGVAMLLRREEFCALGGFDGSFRMYLEDVDLCRRISEAGKAVRREPAAGVVHHGGKSFASRKEQARRFHESKLRYFERLGASRIELGCARLAGVIRTALHRR